jgi:hypothetical protein
VSPNTGDNYTRSLGKSHVRITIARGFGADEKHHCYVN